MLWGDNGSPLAVVEAKKTSVDARRSAVPKQNATPTGWRRCMASGPPFSIPTATTSGSGTTPRTSPPQALRLLLQGQPRIPPLPADESREHHEDDTGRRSTPGQTKRLISLTTIHDRPSSSPSRFFVAARISTASAAVRGVIVRRFGPAFGRWIDAGHDEPRTSSFIAKC